MVDDGAIDHNERVVAVLTGHVLKDTDYVINYHQGKLNADGQVGRDKIKGTFSNHPMRVKADMQEIRDVFARLVN